MARRSSSVERSPAKLSYEEMKLALTKIDRRLDEIKALDIQKIREGNEPMLQVLSGKLQQFLIDTFGNSVYSPLNRTAIAPSIGQLFPWLDTD